MTSSQLLSRGRSLFRYSTSTRLPTIRTLVAGSRWGRPPAAVPAFGGFLAWQRATGGAIISGLGMKELLKWGSLAAILLASTVAGCGGSTLTILGTAGHSGAGGGGAGASGRGGQG